VNPADGTIDLMIKQKDPKDDYVVLKAFIFPYINLVWLGIIVMFLGFMLTAVNKILKKEKHSVV
jgi:cytochrome c-type biogenesis protein CcmF